MKSIIVLSILLIGLHCTLEGQSGEAACRTELARVNPGFTLRAGTNACEALAIHLQSELDQSRLRTNAAPTSGDITPRSLQSTKANEANSVAAANQGDAVPALHPFALAGGSIGGAGTEGGANALTTLSLNPAIFFGNMDDPEASARLGRLMDFSVVLPLSQLDKSNAGKLEYLGIRGRVNMHGAQEGTKLYESAQERFVQVLNNSGLEEKAIRSLVQGARNCNACVAQFEKVIAGTADVASLTGPCDGEFEIEAGNKVFDAFKKDLEALVQKADEKYFGLDLRADFGDPTLGSVDSASGTALFAGIGYGFTTQRKARQGSSTHVNTRLGIRYKDLDDVDATVFDIDGALGVEFVKPFQFQEIKFGIGLEFRKDFEDAGDETAEIMKAALETDYLYFRVALVVPITPTNSFAVQYGTSIAGDRPSILSINFNWKLLLSDE